jgi:hypothetical protein
LLLHSGGIPHSVINVLKKTEIEKMGVSQFMGLTEMLSIQYLTNIFPSPYPSPPRGEGRVRGTFHGCCGKKDGNLHFLPIAEEGPPCYISF